MAHILIAEDDSSLRMFIQTALARSGHRVTACSDGQAAFEALTMACAETSPAPIDMLLTDIVMPGMDGIELAARARALRPLLPVLYITGFGMVAPQALGGTSAPRAQVLAKPLHLSHLLSEIERVLEGK